MNKKLIQGELKDKVNAEDIKKNMTFLTIKNYVHMQEQLWVWDHHDYIHDGYRVDNSNLLNTHCYTSARLQEVCQATYKVRDRRRKQRTVQTSNLAHRTLSSWSHGKTERRNLRWVSRGNTAKEWTKNSKLHGSYISIQR